MDRSGLCVECGSVLQPEARFCAACGYAVEPGAVGIQRRQLTLLFCDVVGSTTLSERLDPEDFRDLLASYQRVCRDAVGRYEGHISQFLGDGVMSYFGYPIAHEDDAVRAIRAALRILEGIKLVNDGIGRRLDAEIHLRAGLHTGMAVVGEIGPGGTHDRLAVGETVGLAARIESVADADTVVVSSSTAKLVEGYFELEALGERKLKGFTQGLDLFRVVRPTGARTKFEAAARGGLTPHVGRKEESAEMAETWRQVCEGAARVVFVRGEAGIGKSRIVHHFRQTMVDAAARVLDGLCSPLAQATAFAPIIEIIERLLVERSGGDTTPEGRLEALRSLLGEHSRLGPDALPLLAALLSVPGADDEPIRELSPIRRRTRTLEVLRDWTVSSAERVPLALLFEDAHWADPSTLELLDLMASEGEGAGRRRLLCVTARPEFVPRWSGPHVHTIELARLNDGEIEAIATHVSSDRALPPLVLRRIAERSEGVPLFVEEVTKAVLESAALRLQGNRYELRGPLDEQAIPSTVHESLLARFDRLGESRSVAQLGAAIGREFSYALVHAVAGLSDDVLGEHLDRLCRSELAFAHGRPPHAAYSFKHALIQDAIYGTLIKRERARVHERIFLALQSNFPEVIAARPEMAAYHAESAGRRDAAVPLLRDAGLSALGRTAMAEAVKHLGHAIEIVGSLEEPERTALEMDLQAAIGVGYMSTLGWAAPEVERSSARLRDLALSRGDPAKLFQAVWGLWSVHFLRGELAPALEAAEQVLHMALMTSDPTLHLAGHGVVGYTHIYRGDYVDALMHAEAGLALFEFDQEKRLASMLQISPSVSMWNYASLAHWMMGFPERAAALLPSARSLAEELRHAPSRAYGHCAQFRVLRWLDRTDEVRQNAVIARSLAAAEGFELWVPMADIYIAWADARLGGDPAAACDTIRSSIAVMQAAGNTLFAVEDGTLLAEALLLAGRPAEVFDVVQATFDISRKGGQRHCEPELHRLRGQAAAALGDANGAERSFREGIESARAMGTKSLELRSAMDLFRAVGGAEGEKALRGVLDGFPEGHAAREFKLALSLLGEPERHHDLHAPPPG